MTRQQLTAKLQELGISQTEFAARIGRHPTTIRKWGAENSVPHYAIAFLEALEVAQLARMYIFLFDDNKKPLDKTCVNGHSLNEHLRTKHGQLVCGICKSTVKES